MKEHPFHRISNDAHLVQDPHDAACTLSWDKRTTENQKACLKLFNEIRQRINVVYMIKMNLKGKPTHENGRTTWPHIMYPIEFTSMQDAHDWLALSPDPALRPPGLKSWSIEPIRKPMPDEFKVHLPKVRKEKPILPPPNIVNRMGGWSVKYQSRGRERDKFFTDPEARDDFIKSLTKRNQSDGKEKK